jgi:hypothetical protein
LRRDVDGESSLADAEDDTQRGTYDDSRYAFASGVRDWDGRVRQEGHLALSLVGARQEVDRLRHEVESLKGLVGQLSDR